MHGLLQSSSSDILLIQEPWFGCINVTRTDGIPDGNDVCGTAANNMWECFLPPHLPHEICKVAIYIRPTLARRSFVRCRDDLLSSLTSMILDISFDDDMLRLVNIYHDVPPMGHNLTHILSLELDPVVPTLVSGDFNTHGPEWSLPRATMSTWAQALEDWFESNELSLISPLGVATWLGRKDQRPSVLDLSPLNVPAAASDQFSDTSVSFQLSLGSDHAALSTLWTPLHVLPPLPRSTLPGFVIEDELKESWCKAFHAIPDPIISSPASLTIAAKRLLSDITETCASLFEPRKSADPRRVHWWNATCSAALTTVQYAAPSDRQMDSRAFSATLAVERRNWANDYLHYTAKTKLWEATCWHHGRQSSRIPPLQSVSMLGDLACSHEDISTSLTSRFFPPVSSQVLPSQPDDPSPLPTRDWPPISADEIQDALATTSNSSTPGLSGINYKVVKWAFAANPTRFVTLYNECLARGTHPWMEAKVIPIAKPNKADYSLPKAYRPISLLECCGKLMEKIIANRVLSDLNTYHILPPTQFGSRDNHCAVDAVMSIAHMAQQGCASRYPVTLLLFDIQGFFDNVHRDHLVHLFQLFGFPTYLADWIHSFLSNCTVAPHFNGTQSTPFPVLNGTPQGSPLSPIASAIYTIPLLRKAEHWEPGSGSAKLYVDDGGIIAEGATYRSALQKTAMHYEDVTDWLRRCGLCTDPNKCEIIVFHNSRWSSWLKGDLPSHIGLCDASHGELTIRRSNLVRYLGVFFHESLDWSHHVKIMANRARSTIRALHILGNSIRGLDYANWRHVYHTIILLVLTYGTPIWAYKPKKSLITLARTAQNDALRRISGCFRTTPVDPLPHLLAILPISYTLEQLVGSYSDRILCLPPTHALRTITTLHRDALWQNITIPTSLSRVMPTMAFPTFTPPCCPGNQQWSHPFFRITSDSSAGENLIIWERLHSPSGLHLFVLTWLTADSPLGFFALFHGPDMRPIYWGLERGRHVTDALWKALLTGMSHVPEFPSICPLLVLLPNRALLPYIVKLGKHRYLPQTTQFTELLNDFISESSSTEIRLFSPKWRNMPYALTLAASMSEPCPPPPITTPTTSRRERAFQHWAQDYNERSIPQRGAAWTSISRPEGPQPPSFTIGALAACNRRYFSACMQLTTRHCFDANYSRRFRANAGDEVSCPCNFSQHLDGSAVGSGPMRGRTDTDAGSQRNAVGPRMDFDALQRLFLDPDALTEDQEDPPPRHDHFLSTPHHLYTLHHVTQACSLTTAYQSRFLRNFSEEEIFCSELSSVRLCRFLHYSQSLLRPLLPRPDPP